MTDPEELPVLTLDVIEDDGQLEAWADEIIRADPAGLARADEIAEWMRWLRDAADADAWKLVLEVERRVNERWEGLASVLVRYGFEAGRRHPLLPGEVAP